MSGADNAWRDILESLLDICSDDRERAVTFHHSGRNQTLHVWVHDGECPDDETVELPGTKERTGA